MPPGFWREAPGNWIRLFHNNQTDFTRSLRMTPLRQRMIDDMQLRNLATGTQKHYIACVASFARFFHDTPANLDIEAVRQFQLYLINQRKLSPEAINIYISAIKFLYLTTLKMSWTSDSFPRARRPRRLPVVLSQQEVRCSQKSVGEMLAKRLVV